MHINSLGKKFLQHFAFRYYTWENIERVKFLQIAVDKANGEEYFGEFDDGSSVASPYLQALVGKILANHA